MKPLEYGSPLLHLFSLENSLIHLFAYIHLFSLISLSAYIHLFAYIHLGTLSKKNYGIIWEFFPNGGPPPPFGNPLLKKNISFILHFRPLGTFLVFNKKLLFFHFLLGIGAPPPHFPNTQNSGFFLQNERNQMNFR